MALKAITDNPQALRNHIIRTIRKSMDGTPVGGNAIKTWRLNADDELVHDTVQWRKTATVVMVPQSTSLGFALMYKELGDKTRLSVYAMFMGDLTYMLLAHFAERFTRLRIGPGLPPKKKR